MGLLGNEKVIESVLDNTEQSILILDKDYKIIICNRKAQTYSLKIVEKEIQIGVSLWEYIPNNRLSAAKRISEKVNKGQRVLVTKKFLKHTGACYWFEYTFIPIKDIKGKIEVIIVIGTDISDSRQYIKKIKEAEHKYRDIVQSQTEMICKFKLDGTVTFINKSYCNFFNVSEQEIIGRSFYHIIPEEYREKAKSEIMSLSPSKPYSNYSQSIKGIDDKIYWISGTNMAFFDNDGNIIEIQAIGKDITSEKEIQNELRKAKEKAEESERIKSVFLENMSHEVRTPLNGILGFSNLLKTSFDSRSKMEEYIDLIIQSGEQLLSIMDDLLEISLIETNQLKLHFTNIYLPNVIHNLYDYISDKITGDGIQLNKNIPINGPNFLYTDGIRLYQIFMKLLKNAIKFTKSGSVEFGYYQPGNNNIRFFVKDTGIGIPNEKKEIVFKKFRQADESSTRKYGGNGLGLSIAKALIENMGSKLQFESRPNFGSHFYFDFAINEISRKEAAHSEFTKAQRQFSLKGRTILIIEDTYMNYILLKEFLKSTQAVILPAHTGMDALKLMHDKPQIDLVLLDIRLPDMNGTEIARQFKKINPNLPIIAQTAFSIKSEKNEAFNSGCDGFLVKPIAKELLLEMVYECLIGKDQIHNGFTHLSDNE